MEFEDITIGKGPFYRCYGCGEMCPCSLVYEKGWVDTCYLKTNKETGWLYVIGSFYCDTCKLSYKPEFYEVCYDCKTWVRGHTYEEMEELLVSWQAGILQIPMPDRDPPIYEHPIRFCPDCFSLDVVIQRRAKWEERST